MANGALFHAPVAGPAIGPAMRRAFRRAGIFVWAIRSEALCCAAFRMFAWPRRHEDLHEDLYETNRQLAHTGAGHRLRLLDRDRRLRAALDARILSHADVDRAPLGPRRVRVCARFAESAVGRR